MLRLLMRCVALLLFGLLLVPPGMAKSPAKRTKTPHKSADETSASDSTSEAKATGETTATEAASPAKPAAPPQKAASDKKTPNDNYQPSPRFTPMLATTGTLGLFTAETAELLPKGAFNFSAYGNKFGRMPGSATILQIGLDLSYGLADRLNFYGSFVPHAHAHIGCPSELSLRTRVLSNDCKTLLPPPSPTFFPAPLFPFGSAPGFVEDFPFASNNGGGVGNATLGLKYGFLSERLGDPISFSIRNDVIISTRTDVAKLLANGTQTSPLSDLVSLALSKKWSNAITGTLNFGYMFTRDFRDAQGNNLFKVADQVRASAGLHMFPESRFQPMVEYTGVLFTDSIPDNTFGARDPVDGIWGLRMYPMKNIGLDVGYRYMLNLRGLNDRHGFVVKLGTGFWPEKAPPVHHPPTISCSIDKNMVFEGSGDMATVTCNAASPDNLPLTYTWSSTCGRVDGNGPQVRWLSAGVPVGTCAITAKVDDSQGGAASSTVNIRVEPRPHHPPTVTCSADRTSIFAGERVHITANGNSPDGDPLTYTWRASGGQIIGSGSGMDFDTTGLAPANYTVTVRVEDAHGGAADCTSTMEVKAVPPPPQASKISDCAFGKALTTRIDNVCKRILDDVALRLQNEPRANVVIIGYSDPTERAPGRRAAGPEQIGGDRATNAVKYLGEKGIDPSRANTRAGSGRAGATDNRRIDVIWVPEGATY